ncbi:MAG: RNA-binding protein [Phycisphaerae bacterium]|nr:RNA-binding protein [Phycisphaerae bacterium]
MKVYVGNLTYGVTGPVLEALFTAHGTVQNIQLVEHRVTAQDKGFAFVEMETDEQARAAIDALDGQMLEGRQIKVTEAKLREGRNGSRRNHRGSRPHR